jgi:HAD superfamily hydrolase (TIGR01490 family)
VFIFAVVLRKLRLISLRYLKSILLLDLRGKHRSEIDAIGADFFNTVLRFKLRPAAVQTLRRHQNLGHKIFLVTASPDIYIKPLADFLEIPVRVASPLEYRGDRFTGRLTEDCAGEQKISRLASLLSDSQLEASFAYSDHESDLPMLTLVGHPGVIPRSRSLEALARRRGWPVLKWDK